MAPSEYFKRLGAPLANIRWSWGAVRNDGAVVLRVWQDATIRQDGKLFIQLTHLEKYGDDRGSDSAGCTERLKHVELIRQGAKAYLVMCLAKDPTASPREIKSFNSKEAFIGGELRVIDGDSWLEITNRVPAESVV